MNIMIRKKILFAAFILILAGVTFVMLGATRMQTQKNIDLSPTPTIKLVECVVVTPQPTLTPTPNETLTPTKRIIRIINSPVPTKTPEPTL